MRQVMRAVHVRAPASFVITISYTHKVRPNEIGVATAVT